MKILLLTGFVVSNLLTMTPSFAAATGNSSGGGGNAIVCFDSPEIVKQIKKNKQFGGGYIENGHIKHITSVELLDLNKAKLPVIDSEGNIVTPELIEANPGETMEAFTKRVKDRLKLFPGFLDLIEEGKRKIKAVKGVPNGLTPIDDVSSGQATETDTCVRSTIIAQYDEGYETNILVDMRIFGLSNDIFPVESRSMAFWHEYLYYLNRKNGLTSSDLTQTLIGTFLKKDLTVLELAQVYINYSYGVRPVYDYLEGSYVKSLLSTFRDEINKNTKVPKYSENEKCYFVCAVDQIKAELTKKVLTKVNVEEDREKVMKYYKAEIQGKIYATPHLPKEMATKFDAYLQKQIMNMKEVVYCDWDYLGSNSTIEKKIVECRGTSVVPEAEKADLNKLLSDLYKVTLQNDL